MSLSPVTDVLDRTPNDLLATVERYLYGNQRTELNRLAASATTGQSLVTFSYALNGIRPGAYLELDQEMAYVWEATTADKSATIERGMLGTDAAAYTTSQIARVEPRFLRAEMLDEILKEIRGWPTNIYCRYSGELSPGATDTVLDLAGLQGVNGVQLLRVQLAPSSSADDARWPKIDGCRLERRQSTDFPSGYALVMPRSIGVSGRTIRVQVRAPFDLSLWASTTDFGDLGLTDDLVDIIPWGVAGRMLTTRDVARTDANAQGRSRPAEEVRAGDAVQVGKAMLDMRDRLLAEAANRLLAEDGMGFS